MSAPEIMALIADAAALFELAIANADGAGGTRVYLHLTRAKEMQDRLRRALVQQPDPPASQVYAHKFATTQQPAAVERKVHELRLCEASRLHLFPDRLYQFTADPDCRACMEALSHCGFAQQEILTNEGGHDDG